MRKEKNATIDLRLYAMLTVSNFCETMKDVYRWSAARRRARNITGKGERCFRGWTIPVEFQRLETNDRYRVLLLKIGRNARMLILKKEGGARHAAIRTFRCVGAWHRAASEKNWRETRCFRCRLSKRDRLVDANVGNGRVSVRRDMIGNEETAWRCTKRGKGRQSQSRWRFRWRFRWRARTERKTGRTRAFVVR